MTQTAETSSEEQIKELRAEVKALRKKVDAFEAQNKTFDDGNVVWHTEYPHIIRIEGVRGGRPILAELNISVRTIIDYLKHGFLPETIVEEYASELSLAEVYEALAYYHRHQAEIDASLKANEEANEELYYMSVEQAARRRGLLA